MLRPVPALLAGVFGTACATHPMSPSGSSRSGASIDLARTVVIAEEENTGFGTVTAGVGDLNGDGYDDVAIGAPTAGDETLPRSGRVYVHLGGPDGLDPVPNRVFTGAASDDRFGSAIVGLGDINDDGRDDLAISAPYADTDGIYDSGQVQVYLGTETGIAAAPVHVLKGNYSSELFGLSLSEEGDLDNNGTPDLVVGAPGYEGYRGRAHIFLNSAGTFSEVATQTVQGTVGGEYFGWQVAILGDTQGDGIPDLAVSAPYRSSDTASQCGQVYLYPGSGAGVAAEVASTISAGLYSSERLGWSMVSGGDLDQDGFDDLIVAAPYHTRAGISSVGRVAVFRGSVMGLTEEETLDMVGWTANEQLGRALALAADPEGDGTPRLFVAAPQYNGERDSSGRVDRFLADLSTDHPDDSFEGDSIGVQLGTELASAGDVNGDGKTDLLVSTRDTTGLPGTVTVVYGGETLEEGGGADGGGSGPGTGGGSGGSGSDDTGSGSTGEVDTAAPTPGLTVIEQDVASGAGCSSAGASGLPGSAALLALVMAACLRSRRRFLPAASGAAALVATVLWSPAAQARDDLDGPSRRDQTAGFSGLYLTGLRYTGDGQLGARGLHSLRAAHLVRVGSKPLAVGFDVTVAGSSQVRDRYTPATDADGAAGDGMPGDCWFDSCTAYNSSERVQVAHVPLAMTAAWYGEAGRFGFVAGGGPSIHLYRITGSAAVSMTEGGTPDAAGPRSYAATSVAEGGRALSIGLRLLAGTTLRLGELGDDGGHWGLSLLTGADFAAGGTHKISAPLEAARYYQSGKLDLEAEAQKATWNREVDLRGTNLSYSLGFVWMR